MHVIDIQSTSDVSSDMLQDFISELRSEFDVEGPPGQICLRTIDPPSWVTLIAGLAVWKIFFEDFVGAYLKSIAEEAGRETWKNRTQILAAAREASGEAITKFAESLSKLKKRLSPKTSINLAIPIPSNFMPSTFGLSGTESEELAAEIAVFGLHLAALQELIASEGLANGKVLGTIQMRLQEDRSLEVSWSDMESMKRITRYLPLPPAPVAR